MCLGRLLSKRFEDVEERLNSDEKFTKKELLSLLERLSESDDYEVTHILADSLIIKYINDEKIAHAYHKVGKWYA